MFEEPLHRPAYDAPFRAPLLIVEIKGDGGTWGDREREAKALEEMAMGLAFVPHIPLLIVHPNQRELWWGQREPGRARINLSRKIFYLQADGMILCTLLRQFLRYLVQVMFKQLTTGTSILRETFEALHLHEGYFAATDRTLLSSGKYVCDTCWNMPSISDVEEHFDNYDADPEMLPIPDP